ncbi:MAG: transposase [Patescibacteria group bacterium]
MGQGMRNIKNVRLKGFDYTSNGYYFVTAVGNYRQKFFLGKEDQVKDELADLIKSIPGLGLDYFVVMPNHVHIIFILENCRLRLGEIVRRFKAKVSRRIGAAVWQPNYYEHIIRNEKALNKIREYVVNNPEEERLKFEEFYGR